MSSYKTFLTFSNHNFFLDENVNFIGKKFKIFLVAPFSC